jgi:hypothetical protein
MSALDDLLAQQGVSSGAPAAPAAPSPSGQAPSAPGQTPSPLDALLSQHGVQQAVRGAGKAVDKSIGGYFKNGPKKWLEWGAGALQAPQRALEAVETGQDVGKAFMHPKEGQELFDAVKDKSGIRNLENTTLAGDDPLHKFARGVTDTALSIVNDPLNLAGPVLKGLGVGAKLAQGGEAVAKAMPPLGKVADYFRPGAELSHLTNDEEDLVRGALGRSKYAADTELHNAKPIVQSELAALRTGTVPLRVRALFRNRANIPTTFNRPTEVLDALEKDIRDYHRSGAHPGSYHEQLKNLGLSDPATRGLGAAEATTNDALKFLNYSRKLGNKMFLTVPFPHGLNLTDLHYNKYGVGSTLKGLALSSEIASGKISPATQNTMNLLKSYGGAFRYNDLYSGLGPGILGAAQRTANTVQNKFLNSLEMGYRIQAFRDEIAAGKAPEEAATAVEKAFGSDLPSRATKTATQLGTPFAQFHGQTIPGTFGRTLVNNPERISNAVKIDQGINRNSQGRQPGPKQPQYVSGVPGTSGVRASGEWLQYLSTLAGPLSQLHGAYSSLSQIQQGHVTKAVQQLVGHFVPAGETVNALMELFLSTATGRNQKGEHGESGTEDLLQSLAGGWYTGGSKR